uniref:GH18 domain-containing protein n=1 Tax=Eutreptiella gymnastica TaxID=73025 RepID=A0A7S1NGW1_9EUGL|mmetsp:Transcript_3393/g.5768  ORF Transcript_3393/g.5768 Transcript_3393/m.5768 type:complete len:830 (+) Transcript_3393:210-2699(+)
MHFCWRTFCCLLSALIFRVDGHGAIISISGSSKGGRNWQAHQGHVKGLSEWDPYSLNGVAGRVDETNSPCGEPGQTSHAEQYRGMENHWLVDGSWAPGQEVEISMRITANHGGQMEFRWMCGDDKSTTEMEDFYDVASGLLTESACFGTYPSANFRNGRCLVPRLLQRVHKGETKNYWARKPDQYILAQSPQCQENVENGVFKMHYRLPATQCRRIVVQWWWTTSNGCIPPEWRAAKDTDFPTCASGWPTWTMADCDPASHSKAGAGEQFTNCIDFDLGSEPVVSPAASPSPIPATVSPSAAVASPSPSPSPSPAVHRPGRRVVYIGWVLSSWTDLIADLRTLLEAGYTYINLAFWLPDWDADAVGVWKAMSTTQKQASLNLVHSYGAQLLVSCGGATMDLEAVMLKMTGTEFGQACAQFALDHSLDGVDFDLETHAGNSAPFRDGSLIAWAVDATRTARALLGHDRFISHAPQAPYFGVWAGDRLGYVEIMRQAGDDIDFLNVQYYNQGAGVYETYESTFLRSSSWWASTAVMELAGNGVALNKIVVGKCFVGDCGDGYVSAATMAQWARRAASELGWHGGVMNWVHKASRPGPTETWGAALIGSVVSSPNPARPSPSPAAPASPSPAAPASPSPAAPTCTCPGAPASPSPAAPAAPSPSPVLAVSPIPQPSPLPVSRFTVVPLSVSEWYVSLAITPNAEAVSAYLVHPEGRFALTKQSWLNAFTLNAPKRLYADASVQLEIVATDGTSTLVAYPWLMGTRRAMQPLAFEGVVGAERPDSSQPQLVFAAVCSTTLLAAVGVLVAARRRHRTIAVTEEVELAGDLTFVV